MDFEELAREKEEEFETLKSVTLRLFRENELDKIKLKSLLNEAHRLGHYAGHCRGERCARESLGALEPRRLERL